MLGVEGLAVRASGAWGSKGAEGEEGVYLLRCLWFFFFFSIFQVWRHVYCFCKYPPPSPPFLYICIPSLSKSATTLQLAVNIVVAAGTASQKMLDHVSVFSKSGMVLWSRTMAKLKDSPVDELVKTVLLEEKGGSNVATTEWYTLRYYSISSPFVVS